LRCNERIKFSALLDKALALDFDAVATGHYARRVDGAHGAELHRAVDQAKDQSYVLAGLTPDRLRHALFPLGETTKPQVRAEAAARGLRVADKPDSHDICFIPDGDTAGFLARRLGRRPGVIVDLEGAPVGRHEGSYAFTVGQRRGLALGDPAPGGQRRYVLGIEPAANTVTVGPASALDVDRITGGRATWCGPVPAAGSRIGVQVRAHGEEVPARIARLGAGGVELELDGAIRGVAPGQAVVMYDGTRVLGSATIAGGRPPAP
ncbi:MAG: tRNA 2-thiouridine(34) synthase MnmA, partial [Kineosporiaceae bacterium]|nr:tRNA 2-thiouridine(34) synthase MnmA [Kineosporiaceae bacterium]